MRPPIAGPYGPHRPLGVFTFMLGPFATSSHVLDVCGPQLSFRTAGFVARHFKWGIFVFSQVRVLIVTTGELTNGEMPLQCACRARKSSMGPNCPSNIVPAHAFWGGQCSIEPHRVRSGPRKLSPDPTN